MSTGSPCKRRRHHTRRGCTQHQKAQHPTTNAPLSKPICLTVASSSGSTSLSESSDTDTSIAQRGALEQLPCATAAAYATAKTQAAPAAPTNTRAQLGGTRHYARRHQRSSKDGTDSPRVRTAQLGGTTRDATKQGTDSPREGAIPLSPWLRSHLLLSSSLFSFSFYFRNQNGLNGETPAICARVVIQISKKGHSGDTLTAPLHN